MSEDDDMAKKRRAAKAAKPKAARKAGGYGPDTVWGLRDAYNELVPAALKLGIKCRLLGLKAKKENPERYPNGTAFATKDAGLAAIKRLQAAITKAKK